MNKWILWVCFLMPFCGWSVVIPEYMELVAIEEEVRALQDRLNQHQLEEMNEEVEGQRYMIGDWDVYGQELEHVRKQQEEDNQIKSQIQKLEQRKAALLKPQTKNQ